MSSVRPSNSGCTWIAERALRYLEMLLAAPRASLTLPSYSPNYPRASRIRWTHARHCPFLNRTEWSPIRSVIIRVIAWESDLFITSMITDRIGRHEVLLPINHKNYNLREKNSQVMKKGENSH